VTNTEKRLAAEVLELASDSFSNHGCNDFILADTPGNREFVRAMNVGSGIEGEDAEPNPHNGKLYVQDWMVMSYCARLLKQESREGL
jgi:hypothetical protein